ncbi:MAG: hypothetical protein V2J24_07670 [Pseudomonadales bacterium]|nr:hypothetical protein [Pseudomonadales bacterium]
MDGSGVRAGLERWAIKLAERAQPGIFSQKRVLMVPGLQHVGMSEALGSRAQAVRYADPAVFFGLPQVLGIGTRRTAASAAPATLNGLVEQAHTAPWPAPATRVNGGALAKSCEWADILAGNGAMILRHGPKSLAGKTIVADSLSREEVSEFERRGASIVVTLLPPLDAEEEFARHSAVTLEALLAALRRDTERPPDEDAYLDLMADLSWKPAIRYLDPEDAAIHRFAFVIHPLSIKFIHNDPMYRWTRFLPDGLVERIAARMPPTYISTITGGVSPTTGQRIEGTLYALGATPRIMMSRGERATYRQLIAAARMAERHGSRIMGLGAFTSVVGDAGITVDRETGIAITSGNSLTVAATLEAAKQAVRRMGIEDLTRGRVMIIGATGSIGAVCSRLLAQAIRDVVLVSIEPERLIELKSLIQQETPGARVAIATHSYDLLPECDLVVTTTSAFGKRVLDISRCKPGAVICDVARPPDVSEDEAALRPDVLIVESGEVLIPGDIDFGYDIGLPPKVAYACLAETALLAMEGRFESFTLGRQLEMDKVKTIYRLFKKHGFELAELRSHGEVVTEEMFAEKRAEARRLASDPELLEKTRAEVAARLAEIPPAAKGVHVAGKPAGSSLEWLGTLLNAIGRRGEPQSP